MKDIKILDSVIKTPGNIHSQMVKCGKRGCKCLKGDLHGPYFYYRYWKLSHRAWIQKKRYLSKADAKRLHTALQKHKSTIQAANEDTYRELRRKVNQRIRSGETGITQRRFAKISVPVKNFI